MTTVKKEVSRTKALARAQAAIGKVYKAGKYTFVYHTPFDYDNLSGATTPATGSIYSWSVLRRRNEVVSLALHLMGYNEEFCKGVDYYLQGDDFGTADELLKKYETGLTSTNCKEYLI